MKRNHALCWMGLAVAFAAPVSAQQGAPEMTPEEKAQMEAYVAAGTPGAPHAEMAKYVGDYDLKIKAWHKPGTEPTQDTGTATRKLILGGRVLVEDVDATMMGEAFSGHGMQGYENATGRYWSTWNDSMSTGIMVSDGTCDAKGACAFSGSWIDPVTKKKATSRLTTHWVDAKTELFEMYGPGPDGKEMKMMEMTYSKK